VTVSPTSISASNITSGTFSTDRLPTVPIAKGGTGATVASTALSNLGGFSSAGGTISGAVNISGKLDVQNNAMHIGSGSNGAKLNFGDGDYVYLYESTDDHLYIKADKGLHLQCGSNSSYDITVQHGSDPAISLLGGGGSSKMATGSFYYSGSTQSVNVGFQPVLVIFTGAGQSLLIGILNNDEIRACKNGSWQTASVDTYTSSTGFKITSGAVSGTQTIKYAAFG